MSDIDRLLEKLAAGTTTDEEAQILFAWLQQHRDQWIFSMYAEYLVRLEKDHHTRGSGQAKSTLKQIHNRIEQEQTNRQVGSAREVKVLAHRPTRYYYLTAAAAVLVLGMVGWWYAQYDSPVHQQVATQGTLPTGIVEKINTESGVMPVALPDGSSVWLYPKSRLRYASSFNGPQRKVSLWGKAFFEVSRDPTRPFIVSAREMVTEVLGTSFTVEAYENQASFLVTVKTGKVSVSTQRQFAESQSPGQNPGIDVVANQQAVFNRSTQAFASSAVEPEQRAELIPAHPTTYRFREAPVGEILATLSRDYHTPIQWDKEILTGCALTTTLTDKPFFEKLRIICEGVGPGTYYTLEGESIQVISQGCNN